MLKRRIFRSSRHRGVGVVATPYFILDTVAGVYKSNGTTYVSEAAMNTALGITKTGEARVVPTYVDPAATELVTNGTFAGGDISGWTAGQYSGSGAAIAAGSGANVDRLVLTTNGATQAFARQGITLGQGKAYRLKADIGRNSATGGLPSLGGGYQSNFQNPQGFKNVSTGVDISFTASVVTSATQNAVSPVPNNIEPFPKPAVVSFRLGSSFSTESGGQYFFDNVSVNECVHLPGAVWNKLGGIITFTTPATFAKAETLILFGIDPNVANANSEYSRMRFSISAVGDLTFNVQVKSVVATAQNLGTLTPSTQYSLWFHNGPDSFGARLGVGGTLYRYGAASNYAGSVVGKALLEFIPAAGLMWIGRSAVAAANDTFTGTVNKLVLRSDIVFHDSVSIVSIGDSLAGLGANSNDGTLVSTYYGQNGYWAGILSRSLNKPHSPIAFSWGGKYGSDVRAAWGNLTTDAQRTPTSFPSLLDGLAPYANRDPRFVIDMSYNMANAAANETDAGLKAISNYSSIMGQINDIRALYPQFNKFMIVGGRAGIYDVNWRDGGYKKSGMNAFNALLASNASAQGFVFHDLHADLIDPAKGLVWGGVSSPTAQDLIDISFGVIPESLRVDAIHPSGLGNTPGAGARAEGESKRRAFVAAGWDTFSTAGTIYAEPA